MIGVRIPAPPPNPEPRRGFTTEAQSSAKVGANLILAAW